MVMTNRSDDTRLDKFLWSVRLYKTRSQAADACKNSRILLNNLSVKPSRSISEGDILVVKKMPVVFTYRILAIPPSRLGAKLVSSYIEDLTPEEEKAKFDMKPQHNLGFRKRGLGRPTKRERRDIDRFRENED